MNADQLKQVIQECCNDITFSYNGKPSGIMPEVKNYIPTFHAWHGDDIRIYHNIDDVMTDKFYSGKSLLDLVDEVQFDFS